MSRTKGMNDTIICCTMPFADVNDAIGEPLNAALITPQHHSLEMVEHFVTLLGSSARQHSHTLEENEDLLMGCFSPSSTNVIQNERIDDNNDANSTQYVEQQQSDDDSVDDIVCVLPDFHINIIDRMKLQTIEKEVNADDDSTLCVTGPTTSTSDKTTMSSNRTQTFLSSLSASVRDIVASILLATTSSRIDEVIDEGSVPTTSPSSTLSFTRKTIVAAPLIVMRNVQEAFHMYSRLRFLQWKQLLLRQQQHVAGNSDAGELARGVKYSKMLVSCRGNTSLHLIHDGEDDYDYDDDNEDQLMLMRPPYVQKNEYQRNDSNVDNVERGMMNDLTDDSISEGRGQDHHLRADDSNGSTRNITPTGTTKCRIQVELFVKIRTGLRSFATSNFTINVSTIGELQYTIDPTDGRLSFVTLICDQIQQDIFHPIQEKANMIVFKAISCQASESSARWTMTRLKRLWNNENTTDDDQQPDDGRTVSTVMRQRIPYQINNQSNHPGRINEYDDDVMKCTVGSKTLADDTVSIHTQSTDSDSSVSTSRTSDSDDGNSISSSDSSNNNNPKIISKGEDTSDLMWHFTNIINRPNHNSTMDGEGACLPVETMNTKSSSSSSSWSLSSLLLVSSSIVQSWFVERVPLWFHQLLSLLVLFLLSYLYLEVHHHANNGLMTIMMITPVQDV